MFLIESLDQKTDYKYEEGMKKKNFFPDEILILPGRIRTTAEPLVLFR